ncbi:AraC family transcriptional regulator [Paenibacillus sp. MY03]|uniref:AraC family transcriptional regulator n=1 Tax=Paenibacillus sp. MY03 TaxID=302980 RepID=UPI000B3CC6E2|nr:AraC family transcriptional regulator [Paenibacillus sp. MY03]OUS76390.1 AraC family transcriptional regulator [Paenibacillus sp. MY03]
MDYEFLLGFAPRIFDVVHRDRSFWERWNFRLERERTRFFTFSYVYDGRGTLERNGQAWQLEAGSMFQIGAGERMRVQTSSEDTLKFYSVHYRYGDLQWDGLKADWNEAEKPLPLPDVWTEREHSFLGETFGALYADWNSKRIGYEWQVKSGFLQLVKSMMEGQSKSLSLEQEPMESIVQKAVEYMLTHYGRTLTREELAEHVSLSPGYFSVIFKQYTGLTPIQYLTRIRLDHAKRLLRGSRLPIREVAEQAGFSDSFYFTRIFGRETGISPRDYRNG